MKISKDDMIENKYGGLDYPKDEWGEESTVFDLVEYTTNDCIFKIEQLAHYIRGDWTEPRGALLAIHDVCKKLRSLTTA